MAYKLWRRKAIFVTVITFALTLFMVLNLMMIEISHQDQPGDLAFRENEDKITYSKNIHRSKKSISSDEFQNNFVVNAQIKPGKSIRSGNDNLKAAKIDNDNLQRKHHNNVHRVISSIVELNHKMKLNEEDKDTDEENENEVIDENYVKQIEAMEELDNDDYNENDDDDYDNDNYEYDDKITYKPNKPFQPGDFENLDGNYGYKKPLLQFEEVPKEFNGERLPNKKILQTYNDDVPSMQSREKTDLPNLVDDGIYWSEYAESLIPKGLSYTNIIKLMTSLRSQVVKRLEQPTWDRCGRPNNGFIVLADNKTVCARYRQPHTAFVFGEVLSFYLSRLLGMDNVPAVVLAQTNSASKQWGSVNISSLGWEENKTIAFIQWIDNLNSGLRSKSYIPSLLLHAYKTGQPITEEDISKHHLLTEDSAFLVDIIQWGTMIVFDYLTGNYDRVASMQEAADKEGFPHIIEEAIRNLPKSSTNNKLWLIDNIKVASMQDAADKEGVPHIIEEAIRNLPKSSANNKLWLIDNIKVASMQDAADKEGVPQIIEEAIRNLPKSSTNNKLWLIDNIKVASMQDAADKEGTPHIIEEAIRNLPKSSTNNKLWLIDNIKVASMQDAADKEGTPHIIEEAIRNLPKSSTNNKLWLIDNESGLLDAYDLLQSPKRSSTRFVRFHREMLQTTCVFQKSLVNALFKLAKNPSPHTRLLNFAMSHEPLLTEIPKDKYYDLYVNHFNQRLNDVIEWVKSCKRKSNP